LKNRAENAKDLTGKGKNLLEGFNDFPLMEVLPQLSIRYLYDAESADAFRNSRAIVKSVHHWLHSRGVDLIFVPVPKMTEVYLDHFIQPAPTDGIASPHVRKMLLELLEADVEVFDVLPIFQAMRDADAEYLYNTADTHWAPRGMRIVAKHLADRIERYRFGARARYSLPIVKTSLGPFGFEGNCDADLEKQNGWVGLTKEQKTRALAFQTSNNVDVSMNDGNKPSSDALSPVVVIGHSYVWYFREQLVRELNMPIQDAIGAQYTTEAFQDFLREPERLEHARVLIWVTTPDYFKNFKPLPAPIAGGLTQR
jgi:hypothetical protein